jgi:hypothetical protein
MDADTNSSCADTITDSCTANTIAHSVPDGASRT